MSTILGFNRSQINADNKDISRLRSLVMTPFYGNNVIEVNDIQTAYDLAVKSPGTIVTDLPIYKPEVMGLRKDSKVLLFNDGSVTGRAAAARRIQGFKGVDEDDLNKKVMDAIYDSRWGTLYHAQTVIGLDEDFMVRAHLLLPEGEENLLYNWMLNFQPLTTKYAEMYKESKKIEETDIFVFSDPQWSHPDHPMGLTYFDSEHNCAALLGMKYFGEHKKGTLTLAWSIANRNGYASCHGGAKTILHEGDDPYTMAVFGLSGSGKSTITHAKHGDKYEIKILHDDAFVINVAEKYGIAMEPTYFDKTQDYPTDSPDNTYLLSLQNCGATVDDEGKIVPITQDIRNGNGRAIKSKLWSPNRVDRLSDPIDAIFWIMKDPTLPPLLRVNSKVMGTLMGATLSTKRTSAERLAKGVDPTALVIEPYANPFRTYPLANDYRKFLELIENDTACYILNTGFYMDKKIPKEVTLGVIENLVEKKDQWKPWLGLEEFDYMPVEGFEPDKQEEGYKDKATHSFEVKLDYIENLDDFNQLPDEAAQALRKVIETLKK
ncbi:phosphoenolpyruvate carboxykinase (ATP) [Kallipyga massiliensis]|uniref:phosphoenolpyruvate carboxykinase (ATP) n=1 Tax=Kallipyga massiliensis TaxID=1472764 RepID=UPI0004B309FA|nr:phosphoenolpyruvate carboxykinase (ATP) [Kallipyga massiliensis]